MDSNSIYGQKVYNYEDLTVGYQFVDALSRDTEGCLDVDPKLLDLVVEQEGGGGGEVLNLEMSRHIQPTPHQRDLDFVNDFSPVLSIQGLQIS